MTKGKGCMCVSVPQSSSDAPCRKPMEKSENHWFSLSRLLFIFSVCVLPLFMNLTPGTSSGLSFFSLPSLSRPPSTDSSFPALFH